MEVNGQEIIIEMLNEYQVKETKSRLTSSESIKTNINGVFLF